MCLFSGSFLGVDKYEDLHAPNSAKFAKTMVLLENEPQEHMVCGASDNAPFVQAVTEILGTDLPFAWKAERAEYEAAFALVVEAEAKAEADDKVGLRRSLHPPHPSIAMLHVRFCRAHLKLFASHLFVDRPAFILGSSRAAMGVRRLKNGRRWPRLQRPPLSLRRRRRRHRSRMRAVMYLLLKKVHPQLFRRRWVVPPPRDLGIQGYRDIGI